MDIVKCPVCGREHHIDRRYKVKCICKSNLIAIKADGKSKILIREEDKPKPEMVKCKDCVSFRIKADEIGDCVNLDKMKRNVNGECLTICKRFMRRKYEYTK